MQGLKAVEYGRVTKACAMFGGRSEVVEWTQAEESVFENNRIVRRKQLWRQVPVVQRYV